MPDEERSHFAVDVESHRITVTADDQFDGDLADVATKAGEIEGVRSSELGDDGAVAITLDDDANLAEVTAAIQGLLR